MSEVPPAEPVPGLTSPRTLEFERFPIRLREGSTTQSAWRLSVECDEGRGTIIAVEIPPEVVFYRGDGVFLGWPQDRMELAYKALLPSSDSGGFEMQQLG